MLNRNDSLNIDKSMSLEESDAFDINGNNLINQNQNIIQNQNQQNTEFVGPTTWNEVDGQEIAAEAERLIRSFVNEVVEEDRLTRQPVQVQPGVVDGILKDPLGFGHLNVNTLKLVIIF